MIALESRRRSVCASPKQSAGRWRFQESSNVNVLAVRAPRATGEFLIFTRSTYSILDEQTDGRSTSILDVMSCG